MVATILLVENEEPLRFWLAQILRSTGWNVHAVGSGTSALEVCEHHDTSIDVLITDLLDMQPISGVQLSRMLLSRYPQMQIIFTSASGERELSRHRPVPKHAFLEKPLSGAVLMQTVVNCLQGQNMLDCQQS